MFIIVRDISDESEGVKYTEVTYQNITPVFDYSMLPKISTSIPL